VWTGRAAESDQWNPNRTHAIAAELLGLAESVQAANFYLADPQAVFQELDRYREVTIDDIKRVAAEYLAPERRNVVKVLPVAQPARRPCVRSPLHRNRDGYFGDRAGCGPALEAVRL